MNEKIIEPKYHEFQTESKLRTGNVVLFHKPSKVGGIDLGLVMTIWKGVKAPRQCTSEVAIASCPAFRAVCLQKEASGFQERLGAMWQG